MIAGARSGPVNLLLYSVFRIGNATNNISYDSFEKIIEHPKVAWAIPISLGDSHKGYKVVGTNATYFEHYKYAKGRSLSFVQGKPFQSLFDVVLGSDVADRLGYTIGENITLSHGASEVSFQDHADKPFEVVGILAATGTPVDKSVHVSLKALTALHIDWQDGAPPKDGEAYSKEELLEMDLIPADVTAALIKLNSKIAIFNVQRQINTSDKEAMMAILPGVTLRDLWQTVGTAQKALLLISLMVFVVSLIGMMISLLSTLNERRREMSILRSVGASKGFIFLLLIFETLILTFSGILLGVIFLYSGLITLQPVLETKLGLTVGLMIPSSNEFAFIFAILIGALVASIVPALRAYKNSLADGLMVKS